MRRHTHGNIHTRRHTRTAEARGHTQAHTETTHTHSDVQEQCVSLSHTRTHTHTHTRARARAETHAEPGESRPWTLLRWRDAAEFAAASLASASPSAAVALAAAAAAAAAAVAGRASRRSVETAALFSLLDFPLGYIANRIASTRIVSEFVNDKVHRVYVEFVHYFWFLVRFHWSKRYQ